MDQFFTCREGKSVSTKVRPVFDASTAGANGLSLNDCVDTGPNLLPNLAEVLLRFRRWPVALTTDIRKAFLQIRLKREDQNVQRFLLKEGGEVRVMRCERVIFGCASSPFLLGATIKHHLNKYEPSRVIHEMNSNMYMDDLLTGADDTAQACQMIDEASRIMSGAKMQLSKWGSNSEVVKEKLFIEFKDATVQVDVIKILGLKWDSSSDHFEFSGFPVSPDIVVTKRLILNLLSRIFDPLGFLTPFTVAAKLLFQKLWKLGLDWDEEVPSELSLQFFSWMKGLGELKTLKIPRCFVTQSWTNSKCIELHAFSDASEAAYCAVIYAKIIEIDGSQSVSMVMAKARVAPVKTVTLPRLELLGCLLSARLVRFVIKALLLPEDTPYVCWTDSMVALHWIRNDSSKWKTFVANRVAEIQVLTCPSRWKHCPGSKNPADMGTRGLTAKALMASSDWMHGPTSLLDRDREVISEDIESSRETNLICSSEHQTTGQILQTMDTPIFPTERWGEFKKDGFCDSYLIFDRRKKKGAFSNI